MLWVILIEMKVSQVGCFQISVCWICYYIFSPFIVFFTTLISNVFKETILVQLKFQKSISRCSILQKIRMSNFVILKWRPFEYKVKSWKICPFLGLFFRNKKCWRFEFFMKQIFRSWILISHKITYMGLLLLKLRAIELKSKTESRLLIANSYIFSEKLSKTWFWTVTSNK